MKSICKYKLELKEGVQYLEVHKGAKVFDIQAQHLHHGEKNPCILVWAFVESTEATELMYFTTVFGTETDIEIGGLTHNLKHVLTIQEGPYIWHVLQAANLVQRTPGVLETLELTP